LSTNYAFVGSLYKIKTSMSIIKKYYDSGFIREVNVSIFKHNRILII